MGKQWVFEPPKLRVGRPADPYWILPEEVAVQIRDTVIRTAGIWTPDEPMATWVCYCTRQIAQLVSPHPDRYKATRVPVWLPHAYDELRREARNNSRTRAGERDDAPGGDGAAARVDSAGPARRPGTGTPDTGQGELFSVEQQPGPDQP